MPLPKIKIDTLRSQIETLIRNFIDTNREKLTSICKGDIILTHGTITIKKDITDKDQIIAQVVEILCANNHAIICEAFDRDCNYQQTPHHNVLDLLLSIPTYRDILFNDPTCLIQAGLFALKHKNNRGVNATVDPIKVERMRRVWEGFKAYSTQCTAENFALFLKVLTILATPRNYPSLELRAQFIEEDNLRCGLHIILFTDGLYNILYSLVNTKHDDMQNNTDAISVAQRDELALYKSTQIKKLNILLALMRQNPILKKAILQILATPHLGSTKPNSAFFELLAQIWIKLKPLSNPNVTHSENDKAIYSAFLAFLTTPELQGIILQSIYLELLPGILKFPAKVLNSQGHLLLAKRLENVTDTELILNRIHLLAIILALHADPDHKSNIEAILTRMSPAAQSRFIQHAQNVYDKTLCLPAPIQAAQPYRISGISLFNRMIRESEENRTQMQNIRTNALHFVQDLSGYLCLIDTDDSEQIKLNIAHLEWLKEKGGRFTIDAANDDTDYDLDSMLKTWRNKLLNEHIKNRVAKVTTPGNRAA
jgi:hypothetical protein